MICPKCGYKISEKKIASELGRIRGRQGGLARAAKLTPEQQSERMRRVVMARPGWGNKK